MKYYIWIIALVCLVNYTFAQTATSDSDEQKIYNPALLDELPTLSCCDTIEDKTSRKNCTEKALYKYMYKNVRYPDEAVKNNIEGRLIMRSIITETGELKNIQTFKHLGYGCDEEVVRVLDSLKNTGLTWIPATKDGQNVASYYTFPFSFKLKKEISNTENKPDTLWTMPIFPGCESISDSTQQVRCTEKELLKYMYMNIQYPHEARKQGIQGIVKAQFLIQKDGTVSDIKIIEGIGGGCDEEVLRLIKKMNTWNPKWIPGTVNGEPVDVRYNLPIRYKLADNALPSYNPPTRKKREKKKRKSDN